MIKTRKDLNEYQIYECNLYIPQLQKDKNLEKITYMPNRLILKYILLLRKTEYYYNNREKWNYALGYLYYRRKKNKLGIKLGIEIFENCFDKGLQIYHAGNIVINGEAKIGKNCRLHGSNCIGNNGYSLDCPRIGDNVRLGVGAAVIGNVTVGDNITVAAGAVVVNSFEEKGITIGGVPAKKIK